MRKLLPIVAATWIFISASSAHATLWTFNVVLNGANERPAPVVTTGTGAAVVTFDDVSGAINVTGTFAGLTSPTVAAHIHGFHDAPFNPVFNPTDPTLAQQSTGVLLGLTATPAIAGTLTGSGNLNTLTDADGASPVTTFAAKSARLLGGSAYINVHTGQFQGGEIRGQLINPIPEPGTIALAAVGLLGAGCLTIRRRKQVA